MAFKGGMGLPSNFGMPWQPRSKTSAGAGTAALTRTAINPALVARCVQAGLTIRMIANRAAASHTVSISSSAKGRHPAWKSI